MEIKNLATTHGGKSRNHLKSIWCVESDVDTRIFPAQCKSAPGRSEWRGGLTHQPYKEVFLQLLSTFPTCCGVRVLITEVGEMGFINR